MIYMRTIRLIALLSVFTIGACAFAQHDPLEAEKDADLQLALETAFASSAGLDAPGHIIRVMKAGDVLFDAQTGAADIEQARPITPETVFHIASLSKQITAAALAHAIEDGLVSLQDPVQKWVPETEKYGDALTVAHLVYMTSGLTEYTNLPGPDGRPWATFHYFTVADAIDASLSVETLAFPPGTSWQYSNINYMLLTRIVEQAYGMPFGEVVQDKVFAPLGMSASLINDDITTIVPNRANAYLPRQEAVLAELQNGAGVAARPGDGLVMIRRNAPHYGGSGVMTSMADWSKWQAELLSHSVFGDAFWALMTRRETFAHEKTNDAFGLVHGRRADQPTLWYSGGDIDASTYAITFPSTHISISCFSNNPLDGCEPKVFQVVEILEEHGVL
ncbi:MAG: serine hydrolase domain-containing protein [Pseudomonadota bacterium]